MIIINNNKFMNNMFISCKESRIENNRSFYGCFSIGAFDAAHSLTIANALRRTLLSECTGLGITSVIIENVSHEYSTLPGMRESVLDLLLNLKELVLKKNNNSISSYYSNNQTKNLNNNSLLRNDQTTNLISKQINCESGSFYKPVIGYLKAKGPGVIRAKDLKLPSFIQCVDPEQYIATLAEDGFLSMKILIMEGKGYLIQKNNDFIDYNLVKKRSNFLNELTNQTLKSDIFLKNKEQVNLEQPDNLINQTVSQKQEVSGAKFVNSHFAFKESGISKNSLSLLRNKMLKKENFRDSKPLNLDCIFNPVTKISYLIQDFDNKVVTDFYDNMTFINDISSLIESSHYLNKNLPYLSKEISLNKKSVLDFLEIYTRSQIKEISNYLHPLQKQNSLHHIIIEIWTNGSVHPREALFLGLQNLSKTFLNLQLGL